MSLKAMTCTLGKYDIPIVQMQPLFQVDLLASNILAVGSAMSGKTTFIKTLLNILHKQFSEQQEQIFILDFGGTLFPYQDMPLVSAYFDNSNEEYVKRVFKIMENTLKENIRELNGKNYCDSDEQPIHTTFILDNINAFLEEPRYATYQEKLAKLCRDGLSKGITMVVTATNMKGLNSYLSAFKQKIAFELPRDEYLNIFNEKVGMIQNYPGHGFTNVTVKPQGVTGSFRVNLPYEVQCTMPYRKEDQKGGGETEAEFVENVRKKFEWHDGEFKKHVKKYQTFPKELTREDYRELLLKANPADLKESAGEIQVGMDYVDFLPVGINFEKSHVTAIYGKKEFGKTNLLRLLLNGCMQQNDALRIVLLDDGRQQLSQDSLKLPATGAEIIRMCAYEERELILKDGAAVSRKLSPLQQFYLYLNENYVTLDKRFMAGIYGLPRDFQKELARIPDCKNEPRPFTLFVIQSKLVYLSGPENRYLLSAILPQLSAVAEDQKIAFIFSDVQKMSDSEQNQLFNSTLMNVFLLDNIAEFASERGQKTIFGAMDTKTLKEDYARCERGDGYFYDIEADQLKKMKFIKAD